MKSRKDILAAVLAAAIAAGASGCELMHEMQPHRLWKLNHGSPGMPADAWSYYPTNANGSPAYLASVPDDPPAETAASALRR